MEAPNSTEATEATPDRAELTPAQQRAMAVLLEGGTQERAAQVAGVTTRTIRNWLSDETFAAILGAERRALWEQTLCRLQQATAQATEVLTQALSDAKATVRMRAAKLILDLQLRLQRLKAPSTLSANQKPARNEAEMIVARATSLNPPARPLRLAMPQ